jgi:hypothetical protein
MNLELRTYRIRATKRDTGEVVEGETSWDGLSAIYPVEREDGTVTYVSDLDTIESFTRITEDKS